MLVSGIKGSLGRQFRIYDQKEDPQINSLRVLVVPKIVAPKVRVGPTRGCPHRFVSSIECVPPDAVVSGNVLWKGNYTDGEFRKRFEFTLARAAEVSPPSKPISPVRLQIVGRHQDDFGVLQLANAFGRILIFVERLPGVL